MVNNVVIVLYGDRWLLNLLWGWSQDGGVGEHGVHVSPQLEHLPDTGGGPLRPRRQEEPPSDQVGCGGE